MGEQLRLPHKLTLDHRNDLQMTGVTEVVSFDEETVVLRTELGMLVVQGQQLQLKTLSVEGGQVVVKGDISGMIYEDAPREKDGWLRRLLR